MLLSTSELSRLLNIPDSRMLKALRDGTIRPLGTVGRVVLIAVTEDDLNDLRRSLGSPPPAIAHGG